MTKTNMLYSIDVANNETRKFIGGNLENDIKYASIEDKSTDKSFLIVSVNVGSIAENLEFQGLAHFLEHMLFLGSKKYPDESYFDEFVSKNGGYSNAYTDTYQTVYYFSVLNNSFEKSMDIFSRFFIDPLFDEKSVDREINAIESEHNKNIQQDIWRISHLSNIISKEGSMINKFSTGNLESLKKPNIRNEMIKFYKKYYISSNIKISTISSLPIDKVTKMIDKYFGKIEKASLPSIKNGKIINLKPFYKPGLEMFFLKTVNKTSYLIYLWEIPEINDYYKDNLAPYFLSDIIDSGNEKSLNNYLIKNGFIKGISVRVDDEGKFIVFFDLTDIKHWKEVNSYFRYFMEKLKEEDLDKICDYQTRRDKLLFNIGTRADSLDLALKLANNLHNYPIDKVNIATSYPIKFNLNKVKELLNIVSDFSNVKMILCNDKSINIGGVDSLSDFKTEPYYNIKWKDIKNTDKLSLNLSKKFDFKVETSNPYLEINPVVNKDINLVSSKDFPRKVELISKKIKNTDQKNCSTSGSGNEVSLVKSGAFENEVWFGNSYEFNEAIIYTNSIFTNTDLIKDLEMFIFTKIFIQYLNYKISLAFNLENELGYVSSINFKLNHSKVELFISGWNEKFETFFISIMKYFKNIIYDKTDGSILTTLFKNMEDEYLKVSKENPWQFSDYLFSLNTTENRYNYESVLNFLGNDKNKIKLQSRFIVNFNKIKNMIFNESHYKFLIYGNVDLDILKKNLHFSNYYFNNCKKCVLNKSNLFSKDIDILHPNEDEINNCFSYYYYISKFSTNSVSMLILFQSAIQQKFYDSLRTKQQFGYLVKSFVTKSDTDYYFVEKIQSERSVENIKTAIDKFNNEFVENFTEDGFEELKKSVHDDLKEPDNSTSDTFSRFVGEISNNTYLFERSDLLAEKVLSINISDFKEFLNRFLNDINPNTISIKGKKKMNKY